MGGVWAQGSQQDANEFLMYVFVYGSFFLSNFSFHCSGHYAMIKGFLVLLTVYFSSACS
jgi:hypothetical protein